MERKIADKKSNKSVDSQTDSEELDHGPNVLTIQSDDPREQLTLVAARSEPPRPINLFSGSNAIIGDCISIYISPSKLKDDVESVKVGHEQLAQDHSALRDYVEGIKMDHEQLAQRLAKALEDTKMQKGLKHITPEDTNIVKDTYKQLHRTHEIHKVDENDRIVLKEVDVSDFAVKLKISRCSRAEVNFRDEAKRYLEHLEDVTGDDIDISNLIGDKHRVTFIRGIAGMGKSVLAKQLTYGWANGDIYQNFKMCVMFECRDLNYFKDHEGAQLKTHEILFEFVKSKVNYDLGDGEGVLVIVDGLDELFDITEKDSIIEQLLSRKIYPKSNVILTGRPHIEFKLNSYRKVGGLQTVEIQGLTNDQIKIYVKKFFACREHILDINNAKRASNVPIIHVPQFLNTLCCIAILLKGEAISNCTELYCWTVFLLLKQHADKLGVSGKRASKIFNEFSQALSVLSEVCHNLLTKSRIIFEGDIISLLGDIGKDKGFVQSLFVDVSDNITEKYQFKHLSLMEFLAALYICKKDRETFMEILKENLKRGFIEVVSFVCSLLSGFSYRGIIKEILKNVVGLEQEVNEKLLLGDVIELLNDCGLDDETKLSRSFEIITLFLNESLNDRDCIMSIISKCHCNDFYSNSITTEHICRICRHLESCGWKDDDIRMAFTGVQFWRLEVSNVKQLDVVAVKGCFRVGDGIWLWNIKTTVSAIRSRFGSGNKNGFCGRLGIVGCQFDDDENGSISSDRQLEGLEIRDCQLKTVDSLINACDWGLSCEWFGLYELDINIEWWEKLVEAVEWRQRKGDLKMRELDVKYCTTEMSYDMKMRIVQCGLKLNINLKEVKLPSSSVSLPAIDLQPSTEPPSISKATDPSQVLPPLAVSTSLRMISPIPDVHSTADHSMPHHSPPSGTPPHDVRTPSQYPTVPASSSPPSAGRLSSQVSTNLTPTSTRPPSTVDPQLRSYRSSSSSPSDDLQDSVRKKPRLS